MKSKHLNFKWPVILILVFMLMTVNAFSQSQDDLLNRRISIDAEDASVSHIISTVAKLSDCNIVLALGAEGTEKN